MAASISGIAHTRAQFADTLRPTRDFAVVAPKLAFQIRPTELGVVAGTVRPVEPPESLGGRVTAGDLRDHRHDRIHLRGAL
jgi:hypothetical protein